MLHIDKTSSQLVLGALVYNNGYGDFCMGRYKDHALSSGISLRYDDGSLDWETGSYGAPVKELDGFVR